MMTKQEMSVGEIDHAQRAEEGRERMLAHIAKNWDDAVKYGDGNVYLGAGAAFPVPLDVALAYDGQFATQDRQIDFMRVAIACMFRQSYHPEVRGQLDMLREYLLEQS